MQLRKMLLFHISILNIQLHWRGITLHFSPHGNYILARNQIRGPKSCCPQNLCREGIPGRHLAMGRIVWAELGGREHAPRSMSQLSWGSNHLKIEKRDSITVFFFLSSQRYFYLCIYLSTLTKVLLFSLY